MLAQAKKVFKGPLTHGVGESLPFKSEHFDFVTMGIALRHVSGLRATFEEYLRVLKPGGRVWILEGHVPKSALGHRLTRFVWAKLIPGMTLVSTGSREAKLLMDYYWDTVEKCVPPETIVAAMRDAGFANVQVRGRDPGRVLRVHGHAAGVTPTCRPPLRSRGRAAGSLPCARSPRRGTSPRSRRPCSRTRHRTRSAC